jgi:hypothetical protein
VIVQACTHGWTGDVTHSSLIVAAPALEALMSIALLNVTATIRASNGIALVWLQRKGHGILGLLQS